MKKAQGMSLNVVIIAAIALIILVVLVLIFTGKTKFFSKTATDTSAQYTAGVCKNPATNNYCSSDSSGSDCTSKGVSYSDNGGKGYSDCYGNGCCFM